MKRLIKTLAVAAVACLMVMALAGCDLVNTIAKSGPSPVLEKHRFGPPSLDSSDRGPSSSAPTMVFSNIFQVP
jgi:hypothetical protein